MSDDPNEDLNVPLPKDSWLRRPEVWIGIIIVTIITLWRVLS